MNNSFVRFIKGMSLVAIVLFVVSLIILIYIPAIPITPAFWYIILFIYLFTILVFRLLLKGQQERLSHFVNVFMLVNFAKLMVYLVFVFIYAFLNRVDAVSFILTFFIYYFIFSFFEIVSLLKAKQ